MSCRLSMTATTALSALPWRFHRRRRVGSPLIGSIRSSSSLALSSAGLSYLLLALVSYHQRSRTLTRLMIWKAYSGYSTRRSGLASFIPAVYVVCVCSIQWWLIGYTLAYGEGSGVIGDFQYAFHRGVLAEPVGTIPALLFSMFQLVFEATVCAIAIGGACERGRILPLIPFIFVRHTPFPPYHH
jgi:ammonia channel protein AmtB